MEQYENKTFLLGCTDPPIIINRNNEFKKYKIIDPVKIVINEIVENLIIST